MVLFQGSRQIQGAHVRTRRLSGFRRAAFAMGTLWVLLSFAAPAAAQTTFDPSYQFSFTSSSTSVSTGSSFTVDTMFDILPGGDPVAGWTFSICHDPALLAPSQVVGGPALDTLKNGTPADFVDLQFDPVLGVTVGVLICFTTCANMQAPVTGLTMATVTYDVVGPEGVSAELTYCDTVAIGGPPSRLRW